MSCQDSRCCPVHKHLPRNCFAERQWGGSKLYKYQYPANSIATRKQYDCQLCDLSTWNPFPLMVSLHATIISPRQTRRANATATLPGAQLISQPFEKYLILTDDFRTVRSRHPNAKLQRKMPSKRCVNRACARCSWS